MSPNDALKKLHEGTEVPPPPKPTAHERTKVNVTVVNKEEKSRATTDSGKGWPKDDEEWRRLGRAVLPWLAGAAIVVGVAVAHKHKVEEEKDSISTGEFARRKARRAGEAAEGTKEKVRSGWFGLKRRVADTADETGNRAQSAKDAAAAKARDVKDATKENAQAAKGFVESKAQDAKEATKAAGWWASDKAHEAADATKGAVGSAVDATKSTAHKVQHGAAATGSAVLATTSAGEEKTGQALKEAGKKLEKDGAQSKQYWRGEHVQEEAKKKFGVCSIM